MNLHITPSFNIDRLCKTATVLLFLVKYGCAVLNDNISLISLFVHFTNVYDTLILLFHIRDVVMISQQTWLIYFMYWQKPTHVYLGFTQPHSVNNHE